MNGKKILNRLIILFMTINVLLLICITVRRESQYKLSQMRIDNIIALLEEKGITVAGTLPRDFTPRVAATLTYTADNVTVRNDVVKTFFGNNLTEVTRSTENSKEHAGGKVYCFTKGEEQLAFDKEKIIYTNTREQGAGVQLSNQEAKLEVQALIKRLGIGKLYKEAHVDIKEEGNEWILTYFPLFEGTALFDLFVEATVGEAGIEQAVISLGEVTTRGAERQKITPIDLVLFGIEEYIPLEGNKLIKEITLGYKSMDKNGSHLWGEKVIPVYKIEVEGLEKPLFVNAYTNEIVK